MAPDDRLERGDGLDWKSYVDGLFAKIQRDVDIARETVPKGIAWQDHIMALLEEKEKTFAQHEKWLEERNLRLMERGNAQDEMSRVITADAKAAVDVANTTAKEAIAETRQNAKEQLAKVEQVATLQHEVDAEKIQALTDRMNLQRGSTQAKERASDSHTASGILYAAIIFGVLGVLLSVAGLIIILVRSHA